MFVVQETFKREARHVLTVPPARVVNRMTVQVRPTVGHGSSTEPGAGFEKEQGLMLLTLPGDATPTQHAMFNLRVACDGHFATWFGI